MEINSSGSTILYLYGNQFLQGEQLIVGEDCRMSCFRRLSLHTLTYKDQLAELHHP